MLDGGLLADDGIFVFEHGADNEFSTHPRFLEHRSYGSVNFSLFNSKNKQTLVSLTTL